MSWDETISKSKCPCGLGTYTIISRANDWFQHEESWIMDCSCCKEGYELYEYHYHDTSAIRTTFLWVRKEMLEEVRNVEHKIEQSKTHALNLARQRYLSKWLSYFEKDKFKKDVWKRLTDNGKRIPSLSTFYNQTKDKKLIGYLDAYFRFSNLEYILYKLMIKDNEVEEQLQDIKEAELIRDNLTKRMKKDGYR